MEQKEKRILVISGSSLNQMQNCMRSWQYAKQEELTAIETASILEEGTLMHKLLEFFYKDMIAFPNKDHSQRVAESVARGFEFAAEHQSVDPSDTMFQFQEYCKFREDDSWVPVAVEEPFSKVIFENDDLKVLYEGKIDLIAKVMPQNHLIVVDHKTVRQNRSISTLNNQFLGYSWYTGIPNVIVNRIGYQKSMAPSERFTRPMLSYDDEMIDEWLDNVGFWSQYLIGHIDSQFFPQNFTSCDKYSGCFYRRLCESSPSARESKKMMFYKKREKHDLFAEKE